MTTTTTSVLFVLALVQCVFSASVTLTQPAESSFGTGTCFRMRWNRQGMPSSHHFNVTFIRKDGTVALEENTGYSNFYNVKLPAEFTTYTFYVKAINDADGSVVAVSANKTAIVTDISCYPEKVNNIVKDYSFEDVAVKETWKISSNVGNIIVDPSKIKDDKRRAHTGDYVLLFGASDNLTDQSVTQPVTITSDVTYLGFWSQSIIIGPEDKHYIEIKLGNYQIAKWTSANSREIRGNDADIGNKNYSYVVVDIPAEARQSCISKQCDLTFRGYSTGLVSSEHQTLAGLQGLFDDITLGACTSMTENECDNINNNKCAWCKSQSMCIDKNSSCTECRDYPSVDDDNRFGCNWAPGCWYCYRAGKCIWNNETTSGCTKDCTADHTTDDCKECPTEKGTHYFYLDFDDMCPKCSAFSPGGEANCTSRGCTWCSVTATCEDPETTCKKCNEFTNDICESGTFSCRWCYESEKCLSPEEPCNANCDKHTDSDSCSANKDCAWCDSTEKCSNRARILDSNACPACNNTDCNQDTYPGCFMDETGKCIYKDDTPSYCNATTVSTKCNDLSGCKWCAGVWSCLPKGVTCIECDERTISTCGGPCLWCASADECQQNTTECTSCSGKGKSKCETLRGCRYVDGNCKDKPPLLTIKNATELIDFANAVNSGNNFKGTSVILDVDIEFSDDLSAKFTPIGRLESNSVFSGTFDGQGHTVSGLKISADLESAGLFGFSDGMTIRNVVMGSSCSVTSLASSNGRTISVGGVLGSCFAINASCVIENVVNLATVYLAGSKNDFYLGGVIGSIRRINYDCVAKNIGNYGPVLFSGSAETPYIGGVIGTFYQSYNSSSVVNCFNYGEIVYNGTAPKEIIIGGIIGYPSYSGTIENSVSAGRIVSAKASSTIGAIFGKTSEDINIKHCCWTSDVGFSNASGSGGAVAADSSLATLGVNIAAELNKYAEAYSTWSKWFTLHLNGGKVNGLSQKDIVVFLKGFPDPVIKGNNFLYWCKDAECTDRYDPMTTSTVWVTDLYAKFEKDDDNSSNGSFLVSPLLALFSLIF